MNDFSLLEKMNGIPVFVQIREKLRDEITTGHYLPGNQLPSEEVLASQFNVSRMTIRRSIEELIKEGLLYRRHGLGTFVANRRIDRDHSRLSSFFEEEIEEGRFPEQKILMTEMQRASKKIAAKLDLVEGEPIFYIKILQLSNGEPVTLVDAFIPQKINPDLLAKDLTTNSLWKIIEGNRYSVKRALQRIEAMVANKDLSKWLKTQPGDPVLYKERTLYTDSGIPLEYIECYNRGDLVSVTIALYR